jgi:hypothetical protein
LATYFIADALQRLGRSLALPCAESYAAVYNPRLNLDLNHNLNLNLLLLSAIFFSTRLAALLK